MSNTRALRRRWVTAPALRLLVIAVGLAATPVRAETYPSRPITLVVPGPAGGGTDTSWRMIAPKMSELLGQTIVIENRPGASANIGAGYVAKTKPDGYTLLAMISSNVINESVMKDVAVDMEHAFTPISRSVTVPGVLVSPASFPATDLKQLIALIKAHPGKYDYGSAGPGSMSHLMIELFLHMTGARMIHVPYRGIAPAFNDVLAGHVALTAADLIQVIPQLPSGRLRAYAVTSAKRSPAAPDIPTVAESGVPGYEAVQWFGLVAPAGTPPAIVTKLHDAVFKALQDPQLRDRFIKEGTTPAPSASPQDFAAFIHAERLKWAKVVAEAGISTQ